MNRLTRVARSTALALVVTVTGMALARQQPATQPAKPPAARDPVDANDFVISPMRVQEMKAINYLFATRETTLNEVVQPITEIMEKLDKHYLRVDGHAEPHGHGELQDILGTLREK